MENRIKSLIKKLGKLGFNVKPKNKDRLDPICGMEASSDLFISEYGGKNYYFCSEYCKQQFEKAPEDYATK
jgi:YHS domain-containing protein